MKNSSQSFVRFLNLFRTLNRSYTHKDVFNIHEEAVAILAFVSEENSQNRNPTITKIVQKNEFGTPPTIKRRLNELIKLGFIAFCMGDDRRHRLLKVTEEGDAYLSECSALMHDVLRSDSCGCSC